MIIFDVYVIAATIVFTFLGAIWTTGSWLNIVLKLVFHSMTLFGIMLMAFRAFQVYG